jgi:hypothetical protein
MKPASAYFETRLVIFMTCHIPSKFSIPRTSGTLANVFNFCRYSSISLRKGDTAGCLGFSISQVSFFSALELNYVDVYHCKEIIGERCEREST